MQVVRASFTSYSGCSEGFCVGLLTSSIACYLHLLHPNIMKARNAEACKERDRLTGRHAQNSRRSEVFGSGVALGPRDQGAREQASEEG